MDEEDFRNMLLNEKEIKLLNKLDKIYDFPDILDAKEWKPLASFEDRKLTFIVRQKINDQYVVVKMRENLYGHIRGSDLYVDLFNEVIHEGFIGLYGINRLTDLKYSKSFAKILSAQTSQVCVPAVKEFKHDKCSYTVYEYISGETLHSYIQKDIPTKVLDSIYLQLIKSLHYAYKTIKFTHFDLHTNNVMVHTTEQGEIYPVIIDYGSSHIEYQNKDYGKEFKQVSIVNASMWYHDIFRVLLNSLLIFDKTFYIKAIVDILEDYYEQDKINNFLADYYRVDKWEEKRKITEKIFSLKDIMKKFIKDVNENDELNKLQKMSAIRMMRQVYQNNINELIEKLLPSRDYSFAKKIVYLMRFFIPDFDQGEYFVGYEKRYKLLTINDQIYEKFNTTDGDVFNFDTFVLLAENLFTQS